MANISVPVAGDTRDLTGYLPGCLPGRLLVAGFGADLTHNGPFVLNLIRTKNDRGHNAISE